MCASEYRINSNEQFINIGTNPKFEHLINNLTHNFTKLELTELTSLISSYSKTAYRLLKQFRTTGYAIFEIDKFLELFVFIFRHILQNYPVITVFLAVITG